MDSTSLKILYVSEYFPPEPNAAANRVGAHVHSWHAAGHQVSVVTGVPNFPQGRVHDGYSNRWRTHDQWCGVPVLRVKTFIHPNRGRMRRILDQASLMPGVLMVGVFGTRPDIIVASSPTLFAALAAGLAARLRRVPFVLEIGDLGSASIAAVGVIRQNMPLKLVRWMERAVYRQARRIVVQTGGMRRQLIASGVPEAKLEVISNGVDVAAFRAQAESEPAARPDPNTFVVGYPGTMGLSHGLHAVLAAAELLHDDPGVCFRLIGDGAMRAELEAMAAARGLENVHFEGPFPHNQMPGIWQTIDLALVSLRDHATFTTVVPSKIFEAMASGVPVLLSAPVGEASALVERYGMGTVVMPEHPEQLAATIRRLASDPDLRRQQGEHAAGAAGQYDRSTLEQRYLALLKNVAGGRDA